MTATWQDIFAKDATLFPHLADLQKAEILLSTLSEEAYRKASFLDQRMFSPELQRQVVRWSDVAAIALPDFPIPQYIFHIGHVGSTLISRLLGEHPAVLALREPAILRQIAEAWVTQPANIPWSFAQLGPVVDKLETWLARIFEPGQRVMIKASSFVSPLAKPLLRDGGDALFLFTSLERYLQTILAGDASIQEAAALADIRLLRLAQLCRCEFPSKDSLSLVQTIALGWICEMATLCATHSACPDAHISWLDFDRFLAEPLRQLQLIAHDFQLDLSETEARELIASPIMTSYSKAPEFEYSASLRAELLAEAAKIHADDIRHTLLWVENLAQDIPLIATAMATAETRR